MTVSMVCSVLLASQDFASGVGICASGNGRVAFRVDNLEQQIVRGAWQSPKAGDALGNRKWVDVKADAKGSFTGGPARGGYILVTVESEEKVAILAARGHGMVYVNGEPRGGDGYDYGWVRIPVKLKKGANQFLFAGGRGAISARLEPVTSDIEIDSNDATLPSMEPGQTRVEIGVVVRNTTDRWIRGAKLSTAAGGRATVQEGTGFRRELASSAGTLE